MEDQLGVRSQNPGAREGSGVKNALDGAKPGLDHELVTGKKEALSRGEPNLSRQRSSSREHIERLSSP